MIRIYYVRCSRQMGSIGIPGSKMQQAPCPSQKKKEKKSLNLFCKLCSRTIKMSERAPLRPRKGTCYTFLLSAAAAQVSIKPCLKKKKKKKSTLTGNLGMPNAGGQEGKHCFCTSTKGSLACRICAQLTEKHQCINRAHRMAILLLSEHRLPNQLDSIYPTHMADFSSLS